MADSLTLQAPKSEIGIYFRPGEPREAIRSIVADMGHAITEDFDSFKGPHKDLSLLPDMAILDEFHAANLEPGNNAWDFKNKRATFLPILVALNDPNDFGDYISRGFHDCLRLPFEANEVRSRILTFLSLKSRTKELIDEIKGERHLLATALKVVSDAVVITNGRGEIVFVNDSFVNLTGEGKGDLIGRSFKDFILDSGPTNTMELNHDVHELIVNGHVQRGVVRIIKKDGTYTELNASITPLSHEIFGDKYHVYVLRDMSEERLIESRTLQAQKLEALGVLAGGIAHDFNNILTPIMGYAELLKSISPGDKRYTEGLEHILKSATRAKELVGELLSFSRRADEGKRHINPVPVAKEVIKLLKAAVPKYIEIEENVSPQLPTIFLSPVELHQVIMNLVTNAYQAIGDRPGKIIVTLETVDVDAVTARTHPGLEPGCHVRLSVSDNGPGIPESILNRIFDPYFTTKEQGKGTGLGLSVVHNIVQGAQGVVTVYSEEGKGATFRCYFPATPHKPDAIAHEDQELPQQKLGLRIMVVDDDELNLAITCEMFSHLGCDVEAFSDPKKALRVFQKRPKDFDVLFTDQIMPKMSGIDLIKAIKGASGTVKTVVASGYPLVLREKAVGEAGVDAVISKPFTLLELSDTLRGIISS